MDARDRIIKAWDELEELETETLRLVNDLELITSELYQMQKEGQVNPKRVEAMNFQAGWIKHRLKAIGVQYNWFGKQIPGWSSYFKTRAGTLLDRYQ